MRYTSTQRNVVLAATGSFFLFMVSASADTYRWKDKDGKTHYGTSVPAEYRDHPYDVLNSAGMVIDHIEDTTENVEVHVEKAGNERAPLMSEAERLVQTDRLLVIQYRSEAAIHKALTLEIAQLGYDFKIINQSYESTNAAIRDHVRVAADRQRAGVEIKDDQKKELNKLYRRQSRDEKRLSGLNSREIQIRARFQKDLDRYQYLISIQQDTENQDDQVGQPVDSG